MSLSCHLCGTPVAESEVRRDRAHCLACGTSFALDGHPGAPIPLPSDDPLPPTVERRWDHEETPRGLGGYRDPAGGAMAHPRGVTLRVRPRGDFLWRRMTLDETGFTFACGLRRFTVAAASIRSFDATTTWREERLTGPQREEGVRPRQYIHHFLSLHERGERRRRLLSSASDGEAIVRAAELLTYQLAVLRAG